MPFNNVQFMRGQNDPLYGPNEGETSDVNNRGDWRRDPREVRAGEKEEIVRSARRRRCRWGIRPGRRSSGVCNQRRATGPCTRWASAPPTEGTAAAVAIPTTSCGPGGTAPGRPSCTPKKRRGPKEKTICEPRISDLKKLYAAVENHSKLMVPIVGLFSFIGFLQKKTSSYLASWSRCRSDVRQIKFSWNWAGERPGPQSSSRFAGSHTLRKWGLAEQQPSHESLK